jgi:AbrB family looped-hinge helix DNA binding protein
MRITSKGQVTIPQEIREKLGLHPNTEVDFAIERGAAVIRAKKGKPTIGRMTVERMKQGPKMKMSSKELLALLRDEPDELDAD